jgi:ATP:corrinoid adenosyltransferase
MVDIGSAIKAKFPEAVPGTDYSFDEDGGAVELMNWNEDMLGSRPESMEALEEIAEDWMVDAAKISKKQEIARKAVEEIASEYTVGVEGRDELQFELTKGMLAIGQALGITEITENDRLQAVVHSGSKARAKQEIIENADTIEEVEDVTWDGEQ